jgi:hypothetical protein
VHANCQDAAKALTEDNRKELFGVVTKAFASAAGTEVPVSLQQHTESQHNGLFAGAAYTLGGTARPGSLRERSLDACVTRVQQEDARKAAQKQQEEARKTAQRQKAAAALETVIENKELLSTDSELRIKLDKIKEQIRDSPQQTEYSSDNYRRGSSSSDNRASSADSAAHTCLFFSDIRTHTHTHFWIQERM